MTGDSNYVRLCGWLLDQRGHCEHRPAYGRCHQDHVPTKQHRTIEGHPVCAGYLYNGATQYVGATGDPGYREAVLAVWEDMVQRKLYVNGASGNMSSTTEGYLQEPFKIRPDDCYGESCAAIATFRWAHSLFSLTGEARYLDVAERMLYNAILASLSLAGASSFYTNVAQTGPPTSAHGAVTLNSKERRADVRFGELATSCCPPNIVKAFNTVGGYCCSTDEAGIYVKHYGASTAAVPWGPGVTLTQQTQYPWDGTVTLRVEPSTPQRFTLRLRLPAWARGHTLAVNGAAVDVPVQDGWLAVEREWNPGDEVELTLPMDVDRVTMPSHFTGYENRAALERAPIVYCPEKQDLDIPAPATAIFSMLNSVYIPEDAESEAQHLPDFLRGVTVLKGELGQVDPAAFDRVDPPGEPMAHAMLIPYCVWGNRAPSEMRIWLGAHKVHPPVVFLMQQAGFEMATRGWL